MQKLLLYVISLLFLGSSFVGLLATDYASALSAQQRLLYSSGLHWLDDSNQCTADGSAGSPPENVYVIGDSITNGSRSELEALFSGTSLFINAVDGRGSGAAAGIINGEDRTVVLGSDAIVIALGANDGGANITSNIASTINAVKSINPDAAIYWVDVAAIESRKELNGVNASIHDNATLSGYKIISWFEAVFPGESPTNPDADLTDINNYISTADSYGVHPTSAAGRRAFANAVFTGSSRPITPTVSNSATYDGQDRGAYIFYYFRQHGLTAEQAAGIYGNFFAETNGSLSPSIGQGDPRSGPYTPYADVTRAYGLAQWDGGRKLQLAEYALLRGEPVDSIDVQLDYTWYELTGQPEVPGFSIVGERGAYTDLLEQTTVEDATVSFHRKFERSSAALDYGALEQAGTATTTDYETAFRDRINAAEDGYNKYASGSFSGPGCEGLVGGVAERVVQIATEEYNKGIRASNDDHHLYTLGRDEAWCADFVSWVYNEAGSPLRDPPANWQIPAVSTMLSLARERGEFYSKESGYQPQPGDIAIYKNGVLRFRSHVNIVTSSTPTDYEYIGGNEFGTTQVGNREPGTIQKGTHLLNAADLTGFWSPR